MEDLSDIQDKEIESFVLMEISSYLQDDLGMSDVLQIVQKIKSLFEKLKLNQSVPCESTVQSNEQETQ